MPNIIPRLSSRAPLIADGAMGDLLANHSDQVAKLHAAYIQAGAELLFSCTFCAGNWKDKEALIIKGVSLARLAAGSENFVAGSLGPLADKNQSPAEIQKNYEETLALFENTPVDLLVLETQYHSKEITSALASLPKKIPVAFSMTVNREGKLNSGEHVCELLPALEKAGIAIAGLNCSFGPKDLYPVFLEIKKRTTLPLLIKPSAGLPGDLLPDDEFAGWMKRFADNGAAILGGCCGTTPQTVLKIKNILKA